MSVESTWEHRLAEMLARTQARRAARAEQRAQFAVRRLHGLDRRHAQRLARTAAAHPDRAVPHHRRES